MSAGARQRWWIGLSIAVVVGAGLWWLLSGEYVDEDVPWPDNPALTTESFHMAGRWLKANGFDTRNLTHLQELDTLSTTGSLLIIHDDLGRQSEIESTQLGDWLSRGGKLLAVAPLGSGTSEHAAHNPYNIRRCPFCLLDSSDDAEAPQDQSGERRPQEPAYQRWSTNGHRLKLRSLATLEAQTWPATVTRWSSDRDRVIFARYTHSGGEVTLLADRRWLGNWELLDADHAAVLLALVDDDIERVYLQQRAGGGGLVSWLWRQAPLLWTLAALLLALWIWSKLVRLGPTLEEDATTGLQFREQLLASARFDWRHNRGHQLLRALRETHFDRLLCRYPDWRQLDRAARLQHLARLCPDLSEEALTWFMDLRNFDHHKQLQDFVRIHQQLMHVL